VNREPVKKTLIAAILPAATIDFPA